MAREIPGFYYNEKLNRYFKIGREAWSSTMSTRRLDEEMPPAPVLDQPAQQGCPTNTATTSPSCSLYELSRQRQHRTDLQEDPLHLMHQALLCSMKRRKTKVCGFTPEDIEFNSTGELIAVKSRNILAVYHVLCEGDGGSSVDVRLCDGEGVDVRLLMQSAITDRGGSIGHPKLDFISTSEDEELLLAKQGNRCSDGLKYEFRRTHDGAFTFRRSGRMFHLRSSGINAIAWNRNESLQVAAAAVEGGVVTCGADGRSVLLMKRKDKTGTACAFAKEVPILFHGYRDGTVHVWDLKSPSPSPSPRSHRAGQCCLRHKARSCVTGLHPLRDHNYLITSGLNSSLVQWDLRMTRVVREFQGYSNHIRNCKSLVEPYYESFLTAVTGGGDVCSWSLGNGLVTSHTTTALPSLLSPSPSPSPSSSPSPSPPSSSLLPFLSLSPSSWMEQQQQRNKRDLDWCLPSISFTHTLGGSSVSQLQGHQYQNQYQGSGTGVHRYHCSRPTLALSHRNGFSLLS